MSDYTLYTGDCVQVMRTLPAGSVQCCVTSPPYYGLRDYGTATWEGGDAGCDHRKVQDTARAVATSTLGGGKASTGHIQEGFGAVCGHCGARRIDQQIGLEETPEAYIAKLVEVFREVRRLLRDDGTLWLNLGDSYASSSKGSGGPSDKQLRNAGSRYEARKFNHGAKDKDLLGIPWMAAFALRADGWWLRSEIIWHKKAPMPESVTDRPTKAHEQVFLLSKNAQYFYDAEAIAEPANYRVMAQGKLGAVGTSGRNDAPTEATSHSVKDDSATRNRRSVWTLGPESYAGAHFATMPTKLVEPCILAGTSAHGCCAKCGAPWERIVERTKYEPEEVEIGVRNVDDSRGDKTRKLNGKSAEWRESAASATTLGWAATCTCNREGVHYAADDLEIIDTPTGERVADDPTSRTGRAGMNRPRGDNEGSRPITRYEQRRYAEQLRNSPYRERMECDAGSAFAHYIRTDSSGSRPVPQEMLDVWIHMGWIDHVNVPTFTPLDIVPCTVLDPFNGSGTTVAVALKHGRRGIGIDLSAAYNEMAHERIGRTQPLLLAAD